MFRAFNSKGYSDFSEILSIAASDPPNQAATPTVDYSISNKNSLFVTWQITLDSISPGGIITGYKLYADDGLGGNFNVILNTVGLSSKINEYLFTGLITSRLYRFKIIAYNYNP